jgi:O-antigen/teichoic acid export membrane protein
MTVGPEGGGGRSTARVLLGGTTWNALAQFAPVVVNIVMTPYFIHHLGIDRWGLIALVTTIESILTSFDGGLTQTTTRYFSVYAGTDDRARTTHTLMTVLLFIFAAGTVVGGAGWFLSPLLVHLFAMPAHFRPETTFYLRAVVALIALGFARNTLGAVVTARQRFALLSMLNILTYVIWIVGLIITVDEGWGLRGVAITFLAQQAAATLVIVPIALPYLDRRAIGFLSAHDARALFKYSSQVQVSGLSQLANAEFDSLLIGTVLSVHSLAMYSAGGGLTSQVGGFFANAVSPASTHMARVYGSEGEEAATRTFVRIQRFWVIAGNACYAVALGAAYFTIVDWLGSGFRVAGAIATILMAGQGVLTLATMMGVYCVTIGRAGVEMRVGIVAVAVNLALTACLVFVGVLGVVAATAVAWLVACWYGLHYARSKTSPDLPSFLDDVSLPATLITVMVVAALEFALQSHVPAGPIGFIASLGPCLIGLAVFAAARFGPFRVAAVVGEALAARSGGPRAVLARMAMALPLSREDPVVARQAD